VDANYTRKINLISNMFATYMLGMVGIEHKNEK
jgi:hypothetical protein